MRLVIDAWDSATNPPPAMDINDLFPPVQEIDCYDYFGSLTAVAELNIAAADASSAMLGNELSQVQSTAAADLGKGGAG